LKKTFKSSAQPFFFMRILKFRKMAYIIGIALAAVTALFTQGCIGRVEKKRITTAAHAGHKLEIYEFTTTVGLGAYAHSAHLFFDGKERSAWDPTWPIQPELYPNWVVHTFSEAPDAWIVYISPSACTRSDFDQLVACYQAHKDQVDADMKAQFTLYDTERFQVLGRFVYGTKPEPLIFKPTALRYQAFTGFGYSDKTTITQEQIVVNPDGAWALQITQTDGSLSQGGDHVTGKLKLENGRLHLTPPPYEQWHEMPGSIRPDAVDRETYLRAFTDAQGRRLDAVFVWNE
jgi:hypothetical protein